ncbi:MAG: PilZ domain-containing protein [Hyphomicrobiales bacterium]|nr:PilZ domain-containing protein [Hyphomicrobiales bacterium]
MIPIRKINDRPEERRRHQRVKVSLLGRYMLADRREFPCQTIDMSPGGLALFAPVKGKDGERVIAYIDQIGRVEGQIVRQLDNGFALRMNMTLIKREKLADQLTWLANRNALGMPEDRRHERVIPANPRTTLKLPDGREYVVKLIDISISGCAMTCDAKPSVGTPVKVGNTSGQVVRVFETGIAIEFTRHFALSSFSIDVSL